MQDKNQRIRIVMLTTDSDLCGTERIILSLLRHIDRKRFQPALVTHYGPGDLCHAAEELGVPSLNLRMKEDSFFAALKRWRHFLNEFNPHMIQSLLIHSNILGRATVLFRNEIAMLSGISTVYTIEGYGRLYAWIERITHPLDSLYIVNSELGLDKVLNLIGLPKNKLALVHNGIEIDVFGDETADIRTQVRNEFGFDESHLVVGIVAQLRPAKRHDLLIRAAAQLIKQVPELRLLIVGQGEMEIPSKELAKKEGIHQKTIFTGYRSDARRLLLGMDIFALPSVVEGEPVSVMEAMDAGLPIVAAETGGIPEIVQDGISGFICPQNDLESFQDALQQLLVDPSLRSELGQNAQQRVREKFSAERMCAEFQECYDDCARQMGLLP